MKPGFLPHSYIKDSIEMKPGLLPHSYIKVVRLNQDYFLTAISKTVLK
jgi:hypothetical protein